MFWKGFWAACFADGIYAFLMLGFLYMATQALKLDAGKSYIVLAIALLALTLLFGSPFKMLRLAKIFAWAFATFGVIFLGIIYAIAAIPGVSKVNEEGPFLFIALCISFAISGIGGGMLAKKFGLVHW